MGTEVDLAKLAPGVAPAEQSRWAWRILSQSLSASTGFIALVYAAGFLVVSLHHGQFGITLFEFLRARVLAAGLILAFFIALPVIAASRFFGLLGLTRITKPIEIKQEHRKVADRLARGSFYLIAYVMAYWCNPLFGSDYAKIRSTPWLIALFAGPLISVVAYRLWINKYPYVVATVYFIAAAVFSCAVWKTYSWILLLIWLWFFFAGMAFTWLHRLFNDLARLRAHDWETTVLYSLGFLVVFATSIYGQIKPSWGGGLPSKVVIHFSRATSYSESASATAYLIDETDKGFYLAQKLDDQAAVFVPRDAVSSVEFSRFK